MTNYKEILRLSTLRIGRQDTALACKCSRNTVTRILQLAKTAGLTWEKAHEMTVEEISKALFPSQEMQVTYKMPDYEYIHREMQRNGTTLNLLWLEYCQQCQTAGELSYKSTQFNKYYTDYIVKTKATMSLQHKPGQTMQVDWAGQSAFIVDTDSGELIKAYIFVAVLPCSGYTYVESFIDQKQESWIAAHINAYNFFTGVTRVLTPDNLKTGVVKNTRDEIIINRTYQDMAEHYGTAILPARPKTPKDKAAVESSVGVISTFILASLRNQRFLSLAELNQAIREKLWEFNHKPFQKKEGSRALAFEEEKSFLLALPNYPFEMATWKIATVQFNYHISVDYQNYSCPYEYIKQKVDVRITKNTVEIFYGGNRIASHPHLYGRQNQYSTAETHMPPNHQQYIQWNAKRFISWAEKTGPHATTVVKWFLQQKQVEQQGYKACMALLKLSDKYSPKQVEAACERALSFTMQPSLKSIQSILRLGQDRLIQKNDLCPPAPDTSLYSFTRGAKYYSAGGNR